MLESKLVPQIQFATVDEFRNNSNNFHLFFQEGSIGDMYRTKETYQRFEEKHPDTAQYLREQYAKTIKEYEENERERFKDAVRIKVETYKETGTIINDEECYKRSTLSKLPKHPWNELFQAYQLMSQLVYENDKYVQRDDGTIDNVFLCR